MGVCGVRATRKWGSWSAFVELDLCWQCEERSLISSACLRSHHGSACDSPRSENPGCGAVCEQPCARAGMSGAWWVSLMPGSGGLLMLHPVSHKGIASLSQCSVAGLKTKAGNSSIFLVRWWGGGFVHFTVSQLFPSPLFLPFLEIVSFFEAFSDYFTSFELAACDVRAAILSDM